MLKIDGKSQTSICSANIQLKTDKIRFWKRDEKRRLSISRQFDLFIISLLCKAMQSEVFFTIISDVRKEPKGANANQLQAELISFKRFKSHLTWINYLSSFMCTRYNQKGLIQPFQPKWIRTKEAYPAIQHNSKFNSTTFISFASTFLDSFSLDT